MLWVPIPVALNPPRTVDDGPFCSGNFDACASSKHPISSYTPFFPRVCCDHPALTPSRFLPASFRRTYVCCFATPPALFTPLPPTTTISSFNPFPIYPQVGQGTPFRHCRPRSDEALLGALRFPRCSTTDYPVWSWFRLSFFVRFHSFRAFDSY